MHSNMSYLNKLKPNKNIYYQKRSFSFSISSIQSNMCAWHKWLQRPGLHGIQSAVLFSAEEMKQRTLTVWPQKHFSKWNNRKYIDIRSNDVTILPKIINEILKLEYRLYVLSTNQVWWNTKRFFNSEALTLIPTTTRSDDNQLATEAFL